MTILNGKHEKIIHGKFKYIIVKNKFQLEVPVIFPENISHDEFKDTFDIVSAGFFTIEGNHIEQFGHSTSLKMDSRSKDIDLLEFYFNRRKEK